MQFKCFLMPLCVYLCLFCSDEIDYLLKCADRNNDGRIDFNEFSERFHGPAQDIGTMLKGSTFVGQKTQCPQT